MARNAREPDVIVRVTYVDDPENARAARDIVKEGFRRALTRALTEKRRTEKNDPVG